MMKSLINTMQRTPNGYVKTGESVSLSSKQKRYERHGQPKSVRPLSVPQAPSRTGEVHTLKRHLYLIHTVQTEESSSGKQQNNCIHVELPLAK